MAASGQTLSDRLNAFRYALAGQGLARTVCKATTLEVLPPKRKHMDYLIACTNEPNISIPQLANLLIERTQHSNWAVVFKAFISIHHLMSHGNERFTQYLATSNHSFELPDFLDRTTPQGYNMSSFVRRYAKYIDDKSISYRALAIDLCKIKSGNDNALRTMNMDNLSKSIPILQKQFDSLLDFGAEPKDLNNGIIMSAFRLLYKDLVRIYVAYQEAIINLLERYFKLSRKKTREALEMYKNYLARMDKVDSFLRVVEAVELDKSEMPDLKNSPGSILKLLEQHLAQLEARKKATTPVTDHEEPEEVTKTERNEEKNELAEEKTAEVIEPAQVTETEPPEQSKSNKHEPPPKPARPSPRSSPAVSPKVSPVASKPAPPRPPSGNALAPKAGSSSSSSNTSKKGPPERPVKPPSRPPPPSATTPNSGAEKSEKTASDAKNMPSCSSPHPPAPPPPPASHQIHLNSARNTSSTNPPETAQTATDGNTSLADSPPVVVNGAMQSSPEAQEDSEHPYESMVDEQAATGCRSTINETHQSQSSDSQAVVQESAQAQSGEVQVNNVDHRPAVNGRQEELPSPAAAPDEVHEEEDPIVGGEVAENLVGQVVEQEAVEGPPEPVANGEIGQDKQTD